MNAETLQILIEPRADVNECINANVCTFILDSKDNMLRYSCNIALPCTDATVCSLLKQWMEFENKNLPFAKVHVTDIESYYSWTERMQEALANMRSTENLAKDLAELGPDYQFSQLQLVKYIKNKYQFDLRMTKNLIDIYYATR